MANKVNQILTALNPFGKSYKPEEVKKDLRNFIAPVQLQRIRQDVQSWREAISEAENAWYPHRVKMQKLFIDTIINGHVAACMERRKDLTLLRKWEFVNKAGKVDQRTNDIFLETVNGKSQNKAWFNKCLDHSISAIFFGYSLLTLGRIENDSFPDLDIIKRWNVSPDRLNVTNFVYSLSGAEFLEGEARDWHLWVPTPNEIGASTCGYGLLYKVGLYEIFLRNLLGFNGDFVELYAQPYRVGKTTKTEDSERAALEDALRQMGSNGYALLDPEDEIEFLETALGGTGYKGYDNLELRLEKKISKLILGHADAMDSIPGKLGNSGEKSPAQTALEDKQTKDGTFISNVINNELLPRMRNLGFNIPEDVKGVMKNDAEIMENNNAVIDQAVKMKSAGLNMDAKYFTQQTGIPVSVPAVPEIPKFDESVKNRLNKIYNKTNCNHQH